MLDDARTDCTLAAIKALSGDALRVYLALKLYVERGGDQAVSPYEIAKHLRMECDLVRVEIIRLCLQGWLIIRLDKAADFFNDNRLLNTEWLLNEQHTIESIRQLGYWQRLIHDILDLTEKLFSKYLHFTTERLTAIRWLQLLKNEAKRQKQESELIEAL